MDKTYNNINRLGIIKEIKSTIFPCDTTPQSIIKETGRKGASSWVDAGGEGGHQMDQDAGGDVYDKPAETRPDNLHNVDVVGRIFGGTLRDQKEKRRAEKDVKIEKLGVVKSNFKVGAKNKFGIKKKEEKENTNPTEKNEKLPTSQKAPPKK